MVDPDTSLELRHAARDPSTGAIVVEGEAPPGLAACLLPRRYRRRPQWWVFELAGVAAPTEQPQQFRISCPSEGIWGTEGIEIKGGGASIRIPLAAPADPGAGASAGPEADPPPRKLSPRARRVRSKTADEPDA